MHRYKTLSLLLMMMMSSHHRETPQQVLPNLHLAARWHLPLKKIIPQAVARGFTALLVVNEDNKRVNNLVVSHLPSGPTLTFRLTNVRLCREIRGRRGFKGIEPNIVPHLILSRFGTRLGRRTERLLGALFPQKSRDPPEGHSRTLTFHNQRDFIFFRHYRYQHRVDGGTHDEVVVSKNGTNPSDRVCMNEVGPRFTLKLRSIQVGTFDSRYGDYEWVRKRTEVGRSRRTFVL